MLEDNLAFFEEFLLQIVDESFERFCTKSLEVGYFEDLTLQPLLVFVLIVHQAVVEFLLDVWEDVKQLIEVVFSSLFSHSVGVMTV